MYAKTWINNDFVLNKRPSHSQKTNDRFFIVICKKRCTFFATIRFYHFFVWMSTTIFKHRFPSITLLVVLFQTKGSIYPNCSLHRPFLFRILHLPTLNSNTVWRQQPDIRCVFLFKKSFFTPHFKSFCKLLVAPIISPVNASTFMFGIAVESIFSY